MIINKKTIFYATIISSIFTNYSADKTPIFTNGTIGTVWINNNNNSNNKPYQECIKNISKEYSHTNGTIGTVYIRAPEEINKCKTMFIKKN